MPRSDPQKSAEYLKQWRLDNPEKVRELSRRSYETRKAKGDVEKERQRLRSAEHYRRRKQQVVDAYGGKCACCGESDLRCLTIDHVNGDGAEERRRLNAEKRARPDMLLHGNGGLPFYNRIIRDGFPDRYQVLCANCNLAKGTGPKCPMH